MLRSSLGFHTLTLFRQFDKEDIRKIITHFKRYSDETGLIKIYYEDNGKKNLTYKNGGFTTYNMQDLRVVYYNEYHGMDWTIKRSDWSVDFKQYVVETKINPKILGGVQDYITAATYDDMEAAISQFNIEAKMISPLLGNFNMYTLKRIDYCVNFDLEELAPGCSPEQIMSLIKRGDIPTHYKEFVEYDNVSHRTKSKPDSFYLMSKSANINCYSKYIELQGRSSKAGLSPVSQTTIDSARNIIRFEVQSKYRKTYITSLSAEKNGNHNTNKYEDLLNWISCDTEVEYYFKKIIKRGNWYSLQEAIKIVEFQNFNKQKERRLINALQTVNQCRSLAKAKGLYQGAELDTFKKTLRDLSDLNINPVTIPKEWGIKHIPNLLNAFFDKRNDEKNKQDMEKWRQQLLEEYKYKTKKKYGSRRF